MKVVVERRPIVGTLKTLVGTYNLLENGNRKFADVYRFHVVDDEGYDNWIQFSGDFIIIPLVTPFLADVKRVLTDEEAQEVEILTAATID